METILGIDLGTTNSVVSMIRDGDVTVLEEDGQKTLPSVVGLDPAGKLLVGFPARNQWTLAPDRTIRSIKRKMGSGETVQPNSTDLPPVAAVTLICCGPRPESLPTMIVSRSLRSGGNFAG